MRVGWAGRAAASAMLGLAGCTAPTLPPPAAPAHFATGLDRPFPVIAAEVPTPERVDLGRLLFFDRILSGPRDASCADCHRPDRGMADGLRTAIGVHGPLPRNTPTLYNVGAKQRLFWDRRAPSLEVQVFGPLFDPEEMAADPGELVARLQAISAYREHFARAFPAESEDSAVSLENVARALAAFERSLVSRSSRYDRWAAGERAALSAAEKRGLRTFRSVNTRCFECHIPPTFAAPLSLSIGVPGDDPGVGGISGHEAQRGQFGVPTLRNVGVSAPYMHDGSIATLEEVLDFYREGGGRARGVPGSRVNGHVRAFDISDVEAAELVAFLRALTDESARPEIPDAVPSGLPIFRPQPAPLLRMRTEALP